MENGSVAPWRPRPVPVILAVGIVFVWFAVACAQHRLTAEFVPNQSLFTFGGANGTSLAPNHWWRLLTSQLLHVHLLHAILNAAAIMFIGSAIQQRLGVWWFTIAVVVSGTAGQIVAAVTSPAIVATGASQAALGCAGFAVVTSSRSNVRGLILPLAYMVVQAALDLFFAHRLKLPHVTSCEFGMLIGLVCLLLSPQRERSAVQ